ncbi:glycosyltransferase family 2 protein [Polymorphobacter sp. PAMC 29334]|uniref:glycosyltransferase family 2 protein n=1 Tax=Polymorphobacter sp. PAMC 29334 TaxID=2862331 RepID=UPI001C665C68|nr:glycosyltransferase family 2 protein [Polymorphobacter sp. PAMC 29334]QYE34621.1 glycosyltransferase family 2 protein [Polymorphobacter sp. PAMC 29334]
MTLRAAPSLDIVVPCYNEEEVLPETARQLTALLDNLLAAGNVTSAQVHFVDDGSRDRTWALIEELHQADPRLCGIKLSRNRGHQNALMAGLGASTAAVVVSIDADLQDDPAIIADMVDAYRGGAEIVLGVRSDRGTDSAFKRLTGQGFYRFLKGMGVEIVYDHADYRLMSRRALNALAQYTETNLFLRALIPQLGFSVATVPYRRAERFAGESKYPLSKMLAFALDGLTSFSTRPLRLITLLGFLVSTVSFALGLWALSVAVFTTQGVPGWASTVVPIYLICGVQLLCIGIIGEYVGKIYFETKRRPRFIIDQMLGDDEAVVQSAKMSAIHTMAD